MRQHYSLSRALIMGAWRDIEAAVKRLLVALGPRVEVRHIQATGRPTFNSKVRTIEQIGVFPPRFSQALRELQSLRNQVTHTPGFEPSDESTGKYLEGVRNARSLIDDVTADALRFDTPSAEEAP